MCAQVGASPAFPSDALAPNARLQAPLIAAARHERRLLAVACKPLLGADAPQRPALDPPAAGSPQPLRFATTPADTSPGTPLALAAAPRLPPGHCRTSQPPHAGAGLHAALHLPRCCWMPAGGHRGARLPMWSPRWGTNAHAEAGQGAGHEQTQTAGAPCGTACRQAVSQPQPRGSPHRCGRRLAAWEAAQTMPHRKSRMAAAMGCWGFPPPLP